MARPRIANPKIKHIGIATTPEKFLRFKALGLVGDEAVDVLLYYLENNKTKLNVQKMQIIKQIKEISKQIESLEFEKLELETKLETINDEIGVSDNGLGKDVERAVKNVLQRYNKVKEIYTIYDFMDLNKDYVENQAYLVNITTEELKGLVYESL